MRSFAQPTSVQTLPLSDGDRGVEVTVQWMRPLIDQGKKSANVRSMVAWILRTYQVQAFNFDGEFRAIFHWVKENIRWTKDATGKEGIQSADKTLEWRIGDCDDFTILICSMLGAIGHRTRLITISNHSDEPEIFSHIFPEVQLESGKWIPMDGGRRFPSFGKGPSKYIRRHVWDVDTDEDYEDSRGMGALGLGRGVSRMMRRRPMGRRMGWNTPAVRATRQGRVPQFRNNNVRLGQDDGSSWDWSQFETEIPALTTAVIGGTANIIKATNAPAIANAQYSAALETAQYNAATNPLSALGGSSSLLLLLGLGVVVVMAMSRKDE